MPDLTKDLERTQAGRYRCPFCKARRGFSYNPDMGESGVWHCFACHRAGDGVQLYADLRDATIREALAAFGIERSGLQKEVKEKEKRPPMPGVPNYSDEEWERRFRLWMQMLPSELQMLQEYQTCRAAAKAQRKPKAARWWQRKIDELYDHVQMREESRVEVEP